LPQLLFPWPRIPPPDFFISRIATGPREPGITVGYNSTPNFSPQLTSYQQHETFRVSDTLETTLRDQQRLSRRGIFACLLKTMSITSS